MAQKSGLLEFLADELPRSPAGDGINLDMRGITSGDGLQIDVDASGLTGNALHIYDTNGSSSLFTLNKGGNLAVTGKIQGSRGSFGTTLLVGTTTTSAATNGTIALASFSGFLNIQVAGTNYKVPYAAE
jgi:hypothetical protein